MSNRPISSGFVLASMTVEQVQMRRQSQLSVDDLRGLDHALKIADAAVVAVLFPLGCLVFKVFAEIAELARGLHVLKQLRPQLQAADASPD